MLKYRFFAPGNGRHLSFSIFTQTTACMFISFSTGAVHQKQVKGFLMQISLVDESHLTTVTNHIGIAAASSIEVAANRKQIVNIATRGTM
jgi:hypothetical protein